MKIGLSCALLAAGVLLATVVAPSPCSAQISVVVASGSTQKATKDDARDYFSGANLSWPNGSKVQIVDQPESETGKKFYEKYLEKSAMQLRTQWTKLVLSGQATAPVKCVDDDAVKKALAGNPNAIGFISSRSVDSSVKELFRIE